MSYIVIAGDVHGAIGLFYEQALRLQDERFLFFGHHHWHTKAEIGSTTAVGLSRIQREGGMYPINY